MKKRDQPHDRYFKDLMQDIEIAQEFLLTYLDKVISEQIDWNTLALYDGSLIGGANKQLYADVVYRAKTSKHKTDVFFILNHERKPDKLLPLRSLEYVLGTLKKTIKQQQKKPGLIIHITWYNGKRKPYPYARHIFDYFAEKELAQRIIFSSYKLINPHEIPDEELASHEQLGILELFMKHADNPKLLPWIEANRAIASKLAAHKYLKRSIEYVVDVGHHKLADILTTFEKVSAKLEETMLTTAQQIRQEGIEQGMQEGRQEGIQTRSLEIAKNMLGKGYSSEVVTELTGLAREALNKLQANS